MRKTMKLLRKVRRINEKRLVSKKKEKTDRFKQDKKKSIYLLQKEPEREYNQTMKTKRIRIITSLSSKITSFYVK
jgi:hypothetical protein